MTQATLRKILRWGHIIASFVLGTYLYSPWGAEPAFKAVVLYGVFPLMALSGVWMWKQGWIARRFAGPRA